MAGTAFTAVASSGVVTSYSSSGLKTVTGTAAGPSTAGADTTLSTATWFNGKIKDLKVQAITGTAFYSCQPIIGTGAPASVKVNIFSGTDAVAQSTADLSAVTFTWTAIGTDYE